ncbi:hypothetical protein GCM10027297_32870 [Parahaliea aestuarii]
MKAAILIGIAVVALWGLVWWVRARLARYGGEPFIIPGAKAPRSPAEDSDDGFMCILTEDRFWPKDPD